MQIKRILLPLIGRELREGVLRTAMVAARRFEAHLEVLYVRIRPEDILPYDMSGASRRMVRSVLDATEREAESEAAQVRERFEDICARWNMKVVGEGQTKPREAPWARWREESGRESEAVAVRGRVADLIVVGGPVPTSPPPASVDAALRQTGRPVFLVPRDPPRTVATHIAIGWNGTLEAARAVGFALPVPLRSAGKVSVYTTEKRMKIRPNGEDLVDYLGAHDVEASIHLLDVRTRSVAEAMMADARSQGVDLLLIGAYSHTRVRDMVFGGVTHHALSSAEIPTLLAH
ncbi:MAG: universal stress protein [Gammaproteobacteria bacterium]|nr:universal stress protein [Gammaproteobacteria bacterium]NIR83329.1 universal stress protein [Gammaproteobacteria bacterium]NIR91129.1 universal stress protein [Gammaproteobacteria bacterium]NIU04496.1 universal stress protein [Gammaproteobacteria bacterium]NIW87132.1 hypothetical protein [Gammaproteobacteria bacterium]